MRGDCIQLVVAHRDRLARFGCELIQQVIEHNGGELVILDQSSYSSEHELTNDLLNILHVFSRRIPGLENYKKQVNQALTDEQSKKDL
jgi:predicted site-specific integrase-resolvase